MASVQDIIASGFGSWSTVAKVPTHGFGGTVAVAGPYHVAAAEIFHAGAATAEPFHAGSATAEVFLSGAVTRQIHG